ncbi:MAG TPA: HAD family hydrolase [Blastocatellia bacterium]|jgi:phosphoglycolate phosphatase
MIQVELMLFDLDGTLIDSKTDLARSINLMLEELGRPGLSEDTIASFVGDGVRVLVYRSLTATHPERKPPDEFLHADGIALMHKHYADQMFATTSLYPHVAETLRHFRDKRKAVVTSKEVHFTEMILERFGIRQDFDCIIGGDTVPARKPDPQPVREAVSRLSGLPPDAVMIGDSENDIMAGKRAGAHTCAVTYGFRTEDHMRKTMPDVLIDSFDKLKDHFC